MMGISGTMKMLPLVAACLLAMDTAAEAGDLEDCSNPTLYTTNFDRFLEACERQADLGYAYAQYNFGYMYELGEGVPKNMEMAAKWYLKAARQDYLLGEANLAVLYQNGTGVPRNYEAAYIWYGLALRQFPPAQLPSLLVNQRAAVKSYLDEDQIREADRLVDAGRMPDSEP